MRPQEENAAFPPFWQFAIVDQQGHKVEGFRHQVNAEHALAVLNDHEEKHGRGRPYRIEEKKP